MQLVVNSRSPDPTLRITLQPSCSLRSDTSPTDTVRILWNNSSKPDDELISRFQKTFPAIVRRRGSNEHAGPFNEGAGDPKMPSRSIGTNDIELPHNSTPRNLQDLGFTPSFMDPESFTLISLAPHHPRFFTPNSDGMGTIFHNQAGDLHTPGLGLNTIHPLSLSNLMGTNPQANGVGQFNAQYFAQHTTGITPYAQQASFTPSEFIYHDSGYDEMDESADGSSLNDMPVESKSNITSSRDFETDQVDMPYTDGEKFRYNVSLRAPTAMVKDAKEIPITYLNKGQAYTVSIIDSNPPIMSNDPIHYRTYIRISFDEEEQRSNPAACWQLWKDGRGSKEAHLRGGKLLAVEYVDQLQGGDDQKHRQVQIEYTSFDGFSVTWTANPTTGTSDCSLPVRFNFLSTDFSHSKGVKGIPVRLCAKTQILCLGEDEGTDNEMEMCYCKVKLFRDHGAERKLSNDIAQVKKTIEKLNQQIAQAEGGSGFGKRKRGSALTVKGPDRPMTITKHKHTWSVSSQDRPPEKLSLEDDLHANLAIMQDMFSSTRPVSVLGLRGEEQDDSDLYPVRLSSDLIKTGASSRQNMGGSLSMGFATLSPSKSSMLLSSPQVRSTQVAGLNRPITIQKSATGDSKMSGGFIEAIDIDPTYRPPVETRPKPIACFYIRFNGNEKHPQDNYRATYLSERTVHDLMIKISKKRQIDPQHVVRVVRANENGLMIMVDDDMVRELPEGQDMVADIYKAPSPDGNDANVDPLALEIKLTY